MNIETINYTDPDGCWKMSAQGPDRVVVTALELTDGTPAIEYDGEYGQHDVIDENGARVQVWGPEPQFPDDTEIAGVIAEHLGFDPGAERVSVAFFDAGTTLDEALYDVLVDEA